MGNLQETLKKIVAARIVKARTTMNYSPGEVLAELERRGLKRTQGSLSQIERAKRLPSVEALYVLAQYLETSTDYLLGLTSNELSAVDAEEDRNETKGEGKLGQLLRHMTKEQRRQVITFAEYLLTDAGRAEAVTRSNQEAFNAGLNVLQRKYGQPAVDDFLDFIATNFPGLGDIDDPSEDRRINKG